MIVYVIHFSKPISHARHYIGTSKVYHKRMALHRAGRGAKILKRANELGIKWRVVAKFYGSRKLEKQLKSRHDTANLCPVCRKRRRKAQALSRARCKANARMLKQVWTPQPKS